MLGSNSRRRSSSVSSSARPSALSPPSRNRQFHSGTKQNKETVFMDGARRTFEPSPPLHTNRLIWGRAMAVKKRVGDILGYARVSTDDQDLSAQRQRLIEAGVIRTFEDVISGKRFDRPGLTSLLDHARPGDILCVV